VRRFLCITVLLFLMMDTADAYDYNPETEICTVDHSKILSEEDEVSVDVVMARKTEGTGLFSLTFNNGTFAGLSNVISWCVDYGRPISPNHYLMDVFSSLDTSGVIHADVRRYQTCNKNGSSYRENRRNNEG